MNLCELRDILRFVTKHGDTPQRRNWANAIYVISPLYDNTTVAQIITIAERYLPDEAPQAN